MGNAMKPELRQFYKTVLQLAIPVTIQNIFMSSLNMVDTIMVGQLGAVEIAAVGQANRFSFIMIIVLFAISSGTAIFTAQYWGKKDLERIGTVTAIAMGLNSAIALGFCLAGLFFPALIMRAFTNDPAVIAVGVTYLRYVAPGALFLVVPMLYSFVLRSMEEVKLPMYTSIISIATNTFMNYCLIFGKFGFPEWGVKGAAIATVLSRIIETAIMLIVVGKTPRPLLKMQDFFTFSPIVLRQFFATTMPVLVNEFSWVMAVTMYGVVYGRMGTADVAAMNILSPVEQFAASCFFGISSATSIMVGNQIGAGNADTAYRYAKRFAIFTPIGAALVGLLVALIAPFVIVMYNVPDAVKTLTMNCLLVLAAALWMKMFNMINIVGILRGGGDTKFAMYIEMCSIWLFGVPLAFFGGLVWKMAIYWVFALTQFEELIKMSIGIHRLASRKWMHDLTQTHH